MGLRKGKIIPSYRTRKGCDFHFLNLLPRPPFLLLSESSGGRKRLIDLSMNGLRSIGLAAPNMLDSNNKPNDFKDKN